MLHPDRFVGHVLVEELRRPSASMSSSSLTIAGRSAVANGVKYDSERSLRTSVSSIPTRKKRPAVAGR